jgi:ATP/maltotriose-dependent transcriptional regulator MalT
MELLERRLPYDELSRALARVGAGAGCIVLVTGEAGIGKTALVDHFTGRLEEGGSHRPVLWGGCDALFTPRPLGPLLDMLPACGAALRALAEGGVQRERIFGAFLDELRRQDPAPVVVFEDVHWADDATLDLLKFLARRIRQVRALVVMTYRDDEVDAAHPLRRVLGEMPCDAVHRLRLPLLSADAVAQLARGAGRSAEGLHALTGGNPFFLTEVLASEAGSVPVSVQDAVLARASRLSPRARRTLDPVAVVPGRAERWLLHALLGGVSADVVAECGAAGMLIATATTVAFRHELARRAWEESLEPGRAAMLHAHVLEALLERGAQQVGYARLVHHAERAGQDESVLRFAPAAAREAASVGGHREAASHYARALRYADSLPATERAALLEAYSYERYLTADTEEAVGAGEAALALRRALNDRRREGADVRWLSRLAWCQGNRLRAIQLGREAVRALEPLGATAELAMAYSNLAQLAMLANEVDDAVVWGERAIALARDLGDAETLTHAENNVGAARLYTTTQEEEGRAQVERALAIALENGFQEDAVRAMTILFCHAVLSRRYHLAEALIAPALAFALEHDIDTFVLSITGWRARIHLERGDWDAAERDARAVLDRHHILDVSRFSALTALGLLRARRGDDGADALLDEVRALAEPTGEMQRIGPAIAARAEAAWIRGDPAAALSETRAAWALASRNANPWYRGSAAYWLSRAGGLDAIPENIAEPYRLQMEGDWRGAAAYWEHVGCPYERSLALADVDDADAQREALDGLERLGARASAEAVRRDLRARGVRRVPRGPRRTTRAHPGGLTPSHAKVLALLAEGQSNATIAQKLFLSPRTVDHHVSAILQRLGVRSRGEAVAAARSRGLLA